MEVEALASHWHEITMNAAIVLPQRVETITIIIIVGSHFPFLSPESDAETEVT